MTLDELRRQLNQLDGELLALIAKRQAISREVAAAKRATGYPTRDFEREREVILGVRPLAEKLGLPPALAEQVLRLLIGGAGKMRAWFVQFPVSQGFDVQVADRVATTAGVPVTDDWRKLPDLNA